MGAAADGEPRDRPVDRERDRLPRHRPRRPTLRRRRRATPRRRSRVADAPATKPRSTSPLVAVGRRPGWLGITLTTLVALVAGGDLRDAVGRRGARGSRCCSCCCDRVGAPVLSLLPAFALAGVWRVHRGQAVSTRTCRRRSSGRRSSGRCAPSGGSRSCSSPATRWSRSCGPTGRDGSAVVPPGRRSNRPTTQLPRGGPTSRRTGRRCCRRRTACTSPAARCSGCSVTFTETPFGGRGERQVDEALVAVARVRDRSRPHEHRGRDRRGLRRAERVGPAVARSRWARS